MPPPTHCPSRGNRRSGKKDQEDPYAEKERGEAALGKVYGLEGGREFLNPNTLESEGNTLPSSNRVPSTYDLPPGPSLGDQDGEGDEFAPYGAHEASLGDSRGPLPTPQPYGCRAGTERYTEEEEEEEEEEEDWRTQKRRRDQLSRQQKWEMAEWLMDQFNRGLKPPHMEADQPETENLFSDNENLPPEHEELCSDAEETPTRQEAAVTPRPSTPNDEGEAHLRWEDATVSDSDWDPVLDMEIDRGQSSQPIIPMDVDPDERREPTDEGGNGMDSDDELVEDSDDDDELDADGRPLDGVVITGAEPVEEIKLHTAAPPLPEDYPSLTDKVKAVERILREDAREPDPTKFLGLMTNKVMARYQSMPRGGWKCVVRFINQEYKLNLTMEQAKQKARRARKAIQWQERIPVQETVPMYQMDRYQEYQTFYLGRLEQRLDEPQVMRDQRNRKYAEQTIDRDAVNTIDRVIEDLINKNEPKGVEQLAIMIQTAQDCYDERVFTGPKEPTGKQRSEQKVQHGERMVSLIQMEQKEMTLTKHERQELKDHMRAHNKIASKPRDLEEVRYLTLDRIRMEKQKMAEHEYKQEIKRENTKFELYRGKFYRDLEQVTQVDESQITVEMQREYWGQMWNALPEPVDASAYVPLRPVPENAISGFPNFDEFRRLLIKMPNWKAAGPDGIYNYYLKWLPSLHRKLYEAVTTICHEEDTLNDWLYTGVTYLFPKKPQPTKASEYRPITCMSNLYKLATRCVTEVLIKEVETRQLLTENQMGTVRRVQGAKEHVLTNMVINETYGHQLYSAWIDVMKAYDSVDHGYLITVLEGLNLPEWVMRFIKKIVARWRINIRWNGQKVMNKRVRRGILQGDSLSPLLFVLCMDPLSRKLMEECALIHIPLPNDRAVSTNHLLYIDDLKLMAATQEQLRDMVEKTHEFFEAIGFKMNRDKSATNAEQVAEYATFLRPSDNYKYLGICENSESRVEPRTLENVVNLMLLRIERLAKTKLSAKNMATAVNEYVLALLNYYVGVIPTEKEEMQKIDHRVRVELKRHGIVGHNNCTERMYLSRKQLGRGYHSLDYRAETMLLALWLTLTKERYVASRRTAIVRWSKKRGSRLAGIIGEVEAEYNIEIYTGEKTEDLVQTLREAQVATLHRRIEKKPLHKVLFSLAANASMDIEASSLWLTGTTMLPQQEARLCSLQDRELSWIAGHRRHKRCGRAMNVDHLATQCEGMNDGEYCRRHDAIARRIHHVLAKSIGIRRPNKIDSYRVADFQTGPDGWITFDRTVEADETVRYNKPDIVVASKSRNRITIVEVGVTSRNSVELVEYDKRMKYLPLSKKMRHKAFNDHTVFEVVPYVMTWDGWVTQDHTECRKRLGVSDRMEAQIQRVCLQMTYDMVMRELGENPEAEREFRTQPEFITSGVHTNLEKSLQRPPKRGPLKPTPPPRSLKMVPSTEDRNAEREVRRAWKQAVREAAVARGEARRGEA